MHGNIVETSGEGETQNIAAIAAKTALSKFNSTDNEIIDQLHKSSHINHADFEQLANIYFTKNEMKWVPIFIRSKYGANCNLCQHNKNNNSNQMMKYKNTEKQNIDKINTYFDQINAMVDNHRQNILRIYKQKSQQHLHQLKSDKSFLNHNNINNVQIQLIASINDELDELLKECYTITNSDKNISQIPNIKVTEMKTGDLQILILDKQNNKQGDIYTVLMNDRIHEFKTDDILITDTKPLTEYSICVKRNNSLYSKAQNIKTSFKCFWSKKCHGKNAKFDEDGFIYCQYKKGHCTVIGDPKYVFRSTQFKKMKFVFLMRALPRNFYFGFVEYNEKIMNMINFDSVIKHNLYSYCLGCSNGSNEITKYVKGKLKGKCKLYTPSKGFIFRSNAKNINNGDKFIFVVDFEKRVVNVYVNEETVNNKIASDLNANTFDNIPQNIIPVYSHLHNQYVQADSDVLLYNTSDYIVME